MKKTSLLYSLLFVAAVGFIASCSKDDEAPQPSTPDECAAAVFPATTGTANVKFLNFTNTSGNHTTIDAGAGDVLAFAIQLDKGDNRPQKLRVYQSDCENALGTVVTFTGKDTEDGGKRFDLRNTDSQIKNVNYVVPTGVSPIYLNFEIDESGNKYTYKRVKINVSGSGVIDSYSGIKLGGRSNNDLPSRLISATGQGYDACDAAGNIESIDITFAESPFPYNASTTKGYLASNPARNADLGIDLSTVPARCGDSEDNLSLEGGVATVFKKVDFSFENVTNEDLNAVSFGSAQSIEIANGDVIAFKTSNNRVGVIKVADLKLSAPSTVTVDVKVQR